MTGNRPILAAGAVLLVVACAAPAAAQAAPRRQFITISYDAFRTQPLHFGEWPVSELVGRDVAKAQRESHDYETRDGATTVDVNEFRRPGRGWGVTVYPFGLGAGATLGVRVSREDLPAINLAMSGPSTVRDYVLASAYGLDASVGVYVSDRSPGWGLGSHAFLAGGAGLIRSEIGDGQRLFAEGGGGLSIGPIGLQLSVKFALNRLDEPVEHKFLTVPVGLRTSVSF